jgi:hypothetical protein
MPQGKVETIDASTLYPLPKRLDWKASEYLTKLAFLDLTKYEAVNTVWGKIQAWIAEELGESRRELVENTRRGAKTFDWKLWK